MDAIDLHDTEPARSHSPYRVPARPCPHPAQSSSSDIDPAMIFATVALLVASLIRLAPPFTGREAFGVEPTLALGCALVCAWVALREAILQLRARRAEAMVRSQTTD